MGLILQPNGSPATKVKETLSKEEVKLVTEFEAWCHRRGFVLDLFCKHCIDEGIHKPRLVGNNSHDATRFMISCDHCDRVYGA